MSAGDRTHTGEESDGEDLLSVVREFDASSLRTCWTFDPDTHQRRYVRADVPLSAIDVEGFLHNERYGFVTRDIYDSLHPASYHYTVRGFDGVEVFRCFFEGAQVGVLCSFDADEPRDYGRLDAMLREFAGGDPGRLAPD
ncbi:DUF7522 family protein [Halarchaeum sp. P4]|uniref:DUF7522 family protein n=1 Tax=Halarchaeum sp. P4 TaxID=3421639 RepID=UPI003EBEE39B